MSFQRSTEADELADEVVIAAVDMMDVADLRLAFGDEAREHHSGASAEIGRLDLAARELVNAFDDGRAAIDADVRAHALELVHMHEAVLKDRLRHAARAFGNRQHGHELRLHVRRETRIWHRLDVDGLRLLVAAHTDAVDVLFNRDAGFLELCDDGLQMLADGVFDIDVPLRHGIGDDRVVAADELRSAIDLDDVRARTADLRTHDVEIVREIDDFRLLRRVFEDGLTLSHRSGHEDVLRRANTREIEVDACALEALGRRCLDEAMADFDFRAERLEALEVQVDRARADGAAARQ